MKADKLNIMYDSNGKAVLTIHLADTINTDKLNKLSKHCEDGKYLDVEIDKYRNKRSKDSNAYLWVLLTKMADVLGTTKDELYIEVLDRYGRCRHITCQIDAVQDLKSAYRYIRELDNVIVNGKEIAHLLCFIGSSQYDSKQMSILLNGVVEEAKELDIETDPQEEIDRLISLMEGE